MDWWMIGKAFLIGGVICTVGQILIDLTKLTPARILVLYVVVSRTRIQACQEPLS